MSAVLLEQLPGGILLPAMRADRPPPRLIKAEDYDRRKFIGSSNVAALMGLAPDYGDRGRQTSYDVYLAKTSETPEEMEPSLKKWLERRKRWEPVVVQNLREDFAAEIIGTNRQYVDPDVPFFAAEVDWEWKEDNDEVANGETKTVNMRAFSEKFGWGEAGTDQCPIHYWLQCQWTLGITGRKRTILAALPSYDDIVFYDIKRDEADIEKMRKVAWRFWHENVLTRTAPDPQTILDLTKMYRTSVKGMRVDSDDETGSKAMRLRAIRAHMDALELEEESLEFDVKLALKDNEELFVAGRKIATWKEQNWSDLDEGKLKEKYPDIVKECTKKGKRRVFTTLKS